MKNLHWMGWALVGLIAGAAPLAQAHDLPEAFQPGQRLTAEALNAAFAELHGLPTQTLYVSGDVPADNEGTCEGQQPEVHCFQSVQLALRWAEAKRFHPGAEVRIRINGQYDRQPEILISSAFTGIPVVLTGVGEDPRLTFSGSGVVVEPRQTVRITNLLLVGAVQNVAGRIGLHAQAHSLVTVADVEIQQFTTGVLAQAQSVLRLEHRANYLYVSGCDNTGIAVNSGAYAYLNGTGVASASTRSLNNGDHGFMAESGGIIDCDYCNGSNNGGVGFKAQSGGYIRMGWAQIQDNGHGFSVNSAIIEAPDADAESQCGETLLVAGLLAGQLLLPDVRLCQGASIDADCSAVDITCR